MNRFFTTWLSLLTPRFCASPHHRMHDVLALADVCAERIASKLKVFDPGFPRDDPPQEPPPRPARSFPTDVPVPEPHDVPAPEPRDVPPPDPGKVPPGVKPKPRPGTDPKPRPVP